MGYLQVLLNFVVFANLVLDGLCLFLAREMIVVYLFAFSLAGSFLVMCITITALQERNAKVLSYTNIWTMMKMVILAAMTLIAVIGLLDLYFTNRDEFAITTEQTLLLPTLFAMLVTIGIQYFLTTLNVPALAEMPKLFSESRLSMDV